MKAPVTATRRRTSMLSTLPVLPALVILLALVGTLTVRTIVLAVDDAGLGGLVEVTRTSAWWREVTLAAALTLVTTVGQVLLGLVFAGSLAHLVRLWSLSRLLLLVPFALAPSVVAVAAVAAVDGGFVSEWFGLDDAGPRTRLLAITAAEAWRTEGVVVLILVVALLGLRRSMLDQAVADGLGAGARWRRVIVPSIAPAMGLVVAYRLAESWRLVDGAVLVDRADPVTVTPPLLVWDTAFGAYDTAVAASAALNLMGLTLVVILTIVLVRSRRRRRRVSAAGGAR